MEHLLNEENNFKVKKAKSDSGGLSMSRNAKQNLTPKYKINIYKAE